MVSYHVTHCLYYLLQIIWIGRLILTLTFNSVRVSTYYVTFLMTLRISWLECQETNNKKMTVLGGVISQYERLWGIWISIHAEANKLTAIISVDCRIRNVMAFYQM